MSLKVTDNGPPNVQPSFCLKNLWLKVYVNSVANLSDKRLKISLLQMSFNFLCACICSVMYSIVSLMGMFVNKDSTS